MKTLNLDLLAIASNSKQFRPLHKRLSVDMKTMKSYEIMFSEKYVLYYLF